MSVSRESGSSCGAACVLFACQCPPGPLPQLCRYASFTTLTQQVYSSTISINLLSSQMLESPLFYGANSTHTSEASHLQCFHDNTPHFSLWCASCCQAVADASLPVTPAVYWAISSIDLWQQILWKSACALLSWGRRAECWGVAGIS